MASYTERRYEISAFALKIIAISAMTFNHIANVFEDTLAPAIRVPFYAIGGLTFPIMAFMIVEGYHKTSNIKKYTLRLLIFGLIALIPFFLALGGRLNVLFTLLLGLITLIIRDRMKNKTMFWFCVAGITLFTIFSDWSFIGVPLILAYGSVKGERRKIVLPVIAVSIVGIAISAIFSYILGREPLQYILDGSFFLVCLGAIPLLLSYKGARGYSPPSLRYLFYIYYPAHLLVIAGIAWLLL